MEQQHAELAVAASSSSASSGSSSSSSRSIHGSMSSAFLGVSSPTRSQSQRRSSPSLYPPPAPFPGHRASRGSAAAASGGSASGSSSSQFHQISPSPGVAAQRRSRPNSQITHSLPTPFLSELSAIRRMGNNIFGDLNVQEMTRSSLSIPMPQPRSHHHTSIPIGDVSGFPSASQQQQALAMLGLPGPGFAQPPLQQQQVQPSFSSLQPLPGGNFSGFPLPASQQPQHMQPSSSSTDLPAASQYFSTHLAPLPSGSTISQSSELPPLPPSLEIPQFGLPPPTPPFGHLSQNNGSSTASSTGIVQPSSSSEMYELPPLPESLQMPSLLLQQVNQEPVVAPSLEPEIISLDDDDELSAVVHSSASSHGHGSTSLPTNFEDRLQLVNSGTGLGMRGAARGAQMWEHDKVTNGGGSSSRIPWNCHGPMPMYSLSEEQALQQLGNLLSRWSSPESSSSDQSMGSSIAASLAPMPELANKFDMLSIGGGSSCAQPQMPWNNSSSSVQNSTPVPDVPKLILGGMDRHGAGASSSMSRRGSTKEHYFSDAEMEKINKDNRLKELMKTDSKRVLRILRNREYVARGKVQKANHDQDLKCQVDALKIECMSLSEQVQSHQESVDKLKTKNHEVELRLKGLKELDRLNQALNDQLQSELQRLKQHCANDTHNPNSSKTMAGWDASSSKGSNN